ncbi:cytochrome c [uncultured Piscinibacter sp.]|uniref:c-type cytochrome n=1 Tax=uncultured Piscinibacter sp. TaxID=1131835 RepID=UPI00260B83E6|nr:cytochrome c [uncultured Piscinibacter sp.]
MNARRLLYALAAAAALPVFAAPDAAPDSARQRELVRMVRQDCGSCHGMTLAGGLGPALTRAALADKPVDSLQAVIEHGRPGTPMPPWRSMLRPGESRWIAERLLSGFPEESR